MQIDFSRRAKRIAALLAGSLVLPALALAQVPAGVPTGPAAGLIQPPKQNQEKQVAPPPALPGATSQGNAAPATENPSDMSPNAALFDAINRGDVAAARDALSRGAELGAHNVLGLTPTELAVDLGRNDILFLLLSMRGADSSGTPPPPAAMAAKQAAPKPAAVAARRPAHVTRVAASNPPPVKPAPAPQQPKLFANDGGAPIPSIGFLGFGNGHPNP